MFFGHLRQCNAKVNTICIIKTSTSNVEIISYSIIKSKSPRVTRVRTILSQIVLVSNKLSKKNNVEVKQVILYKILQQLIGNNYARKIIDSLCIFSNTIFWESYEFMCTRIEQAIQFYFRQILLTSFGISQYLEKLLEILTKSGGSELKKICVKTITVYLKTRFFNQLQCIKHSNTYV